MNKVTWKDIADHHKGKDHLVGIKLSPGCNQPRAKGRSSILLICPFCKADLECYARSYKSCGKRCECGAMLGNDKAWHFKEMALF